MLFADLKHEEAVKFLKQTQKPDASIANIPQKHLLQLSLTSDSFHLSLPTPSICHFRLIPSLTLRNSSLPTLSLAFNLFLLHPQSSFLLRTPFTYTSLGDMRKPTSQSALRRQRSGHGQIAGEGCKRFHFAQKTQ